MCVQKKGMNIRDSSTLRAVVKCVCNVDKQAWGARAWA